MNHNYVGYHIIVIHLLLFRQLNIYAREVVDLVRPALLSV